MTITAGPTARTSTTARGGNEGRWQTRRLGLAAALAAGLALIALPSAKTKPQGEPPPLAVEHVWPKAQRADIPADLPDGPAYSPVFFLDARTSLGTAPSPQGTHLRLLMRAADGALRELRRLPIATTPQYGGFALAGDELVWAESTGDEAGKGHTEIWTANLRSERAARRLTADTGDVVSSNSQYDMLINAGRVYWAAVSPEREPATELRSVPLAGGEVAVRTEPGRWALSSWPWLVSAGSGQSGPVQLKDLDARRVIDVDAGATDLVTCSPAWCRALVLSGDGPTRIDLMRPDGKDRRRIAGGSATPSVIDVAVLDRFEVLTQANAQTTTVTIQQLMLYDLRRKRTIVVADGVGMVLCRGGVLWWSTGDSETVAWHSLDLRNLA